MNRMLIALTYGAALLAPQFLQADTPEYALKIQNHLFIPAQLEIPPHTKVKLKIVNLDATAEEFESSSLNREKLIPAHGEVTIFIGPLPSGSYDFFGEFHPATATGKIVVK